MREELEQELADLMSLGITVDVYLDTPSGDLIIIGAPDSSLHHLVPRVRELALGLLAYL